MATTQIWRYLPPLHLDGNTQMAIDSWLLNQHQNYNQPPCLRFYTWSPPSISLGITQRNKTPSNWHNLTWKGQKVPLIQRPTGGRGVLHQGDLTYAVVTSNLRGNLDEVYRQICQFLILGWEKLGVKLQFGKPSRQYLKSANCFGLATNADLIDTQGNKFIGSAQLRRGKYLLQHGSILLNPNPDLFKQVFGKSPPMINHAIPSTQEIITTLKQSAEKSFNCQLINQPLSANEWEEIKKQKRENQL